MVPCSPCDHCLCCWKATKAQEHRHVPQQTDGCTRSSPGRYSLNRPRGPHPEQVLIGAHKDVWLDVFGSGLDSYSYSVCATSLTRGVRCETVTVMYFVVTIYRYVVFVIE